MQRSLNWISSGIGRCVYRAFAERFRPFGAPLRDSPYPIPCPISGARPATGASPEDARRLIMATAIRRPIARRGTAHKHDNVSTAILVLECVKEFVVIPAKERVKKSRDATTLRHSRESGNPLRRFRKENRADIANDRLRIPAFAGMTSTCNAVRFLHAPFRGNDEVLFDGYCLLQCRRFGAPTVIVRNARFLRTLSGVPGEDCERVAASRTRRRPFYGWKLSGWPGQCHSVA